MHLSFRQTLIFCLCLMNGLLLSSLSFGQYGGYGGGYGGGMGGRRMGGMSQMPSSPPRASVPNIAGDMAQKETKWMKDNLSLSKEQFKDIKHLNNEYASQQQDAIKDIIGKETGRPSPEVIKQVREVMLMFNEEKDEKIKSILTPEQWDSYQAKKPDMQKEIGGFRPPGPKKDSLNKAAAN
jgi:hypothetical protein